MMRGPRLRDADGTEYDPETGRRRRLSDDEVVALIIQERDALRRAVTGRALELEDDDA